MRSTLTTFAGLGLSAALVLTGCGSGSDSADGENGSGADQTTSAASTPKEKVVAALDTLQQSNSIGYTLAVNSTPEDLKKIAAAQPKTGEDAFTRADIKELESLLGGKATFAQTLPEGKTLGDLTQVNAGPQTVAEFFDPAVVEKSLKDAGSFSMSLSQDDANLFDLAAKDGLLYLRADAEKVAELGELGDVSQAQAMLGQLPPVMATPAKAVLEGKWVSLDLVETVKLLDEQGLSDMLPKEAATPAVDQAKVQDFAEALYASIEADSEVTEIDGNEKGDGYRVTVPIKKVAEATQEDLIAIFGEKTGGDIRDSIKEISASDSVDLDVFVKDGSLGGVSFDMTQALEKPVEGTTFTIDVDVDPKAAPVEIPGDATAVDIKGIMGLIPADTFASGLGSGL
ncbi:hypothetical protein [Kineosporia babensis]|uniref:Lipoprotein n=1 Tax=Kineosporia babensis TaxID=499548 RepID=A0A9X1N9V0_9ACTN|nr:hypothetical protein [Kineosporia babensis]MCD5309814.1 hypothetical protein [Kineosporia babensis]